MNKSRGKRPGLRARSKNARKTVPAKRVTNVLAVMHVRQSMSFYSVSEGAPAEGERVLVRLKNDSYRFGMVVAGRFAAYDHHAENYVTMPHADRITHWMVIVPPAVLDTATAEGESPQAQLPGSQTIEEAIQAAADAPDRAEDVYA